MFFRYEAGILDADVWLVRRTWLGGFIQNPGVADWWRTERSSSLFTQRFIDEVEGGQHFAIGKGGQRSQS